MPLREQLLEIRTNIARYIQPEKQAINDREVERLLAERTAARALPVGGRMPAFSLLDQNGSTVDSTELLAAGKLIIVFFRGRWCPFCVTTLEAWRDRLAQVREARAQVVAISPMQVKHASFAAAQHKLSFPVLMDRANSIARAFGLVYQVGEEQRELYQSVFINLPQQNGDESWELPVPATFAVAQDGTVVYSHADPDYRERSEPDDVIAACK